MNEIKIKKNNLFFHHRAPLLIITCDGKLAFRQHEGSFFPPVNPDRQQDRRGTFARTIFLLLSLIRRFHCYEFNPNTIAIHDPLSPQPRTARENRRCDEPGCAITRSRSDTCCHVCPPSRVSTRGGWKSGESEPIGRMGAREWRRRWSKEGR